MVRHNRININSNITFLITTIVILAVFTIWTWRQHQYPVVGIDDANIFFSYAENFASGNGITYACNEERVEGFTSMLWMLLCTVMFLLGVNEIGVFFLSFLILTITQILFLKVIYNSAYNVNGLPPIIYQSIYVVLILSSPAYLTWMTITLMDTSIWGFVIAGMTYALILPPHSRITTLLCIIIFAIAPLTRPEALLVAPVFLILLWLRGLSLGNSQTTRICLLIGLTMVLTIVFLTIFRVQYFGYPLPNTYYAKVSPSIHYNFRMGENYLYDFLSSGTIISLTVALIVCRCTWWFGHMLDRLLQEKSFRVLLDPQMSAGVSVSFGTLILLIVPVLTGGDHFRMFRFFQPAYPVICLIPILSALEWKVIKCNLLSFQWVRHNVIKTLLMSFVLSYWFFTYEPLAKPRRKVFFLQS